MQPRLDGYAAPVLWIENAAGPSPDLVSHRYTHGVEVRLSMIDYCQHRRGLENNVSENFIGRGTHGNVPVSHHTITADGASCL